MYRAGRSRVHDAVCASAKPARGERDTREIRFSPQLTAALLPIRFVPASSAEQLTPRELGYRLSERIRDKREERCLLYPLEIDSLPLSSVHR